MSTKVYNGFMFRNPRPYIIREQLISFQKENVHPLFQKEHDSLFAEFCSGIIDSRATKLPHRDDDQKETPWETVCKIFHKRMKEVGSDRMMLLEAFDWSFEIVIVPITNRKTLGLHYATRRSFEHLIKKQTWFIDYHYQNQSDKPDEVSCQEWKRRGRDWDKAFEVFDTGAQAGFSMRMQPLHIDSRYCLLRPENVMNLIPSFEKRVRTQVDIRIDIQERDMINLSDGKVEYSNAIEHVKKWRASKEFKNYKKEIKKKVMKHMKRRLTVADVYGKKWQRNSHREDNLEVRIGTH